MAFELIALVIIFFIVWIALFIIFRAANYELLIRIIVCSLLAFGIAISFGCFIILPIEYMVVKPSAESFEKEIGQHFEPLIHNVNSKEINEYIITCSVPEFLS